MGFYEIDIRTVETPGEGSLAFFEANKDFSFEIKRVYYIFGTQQGIERGGHAHKLLNQILFCPYGAINIRLEDEKGRKDEILLDNPSKGIVVEACTWREMVWMKSDSVLCVAASDYYDESDYIRNYPEYHNYIYKTLKGDSK